MLNVPKIHSSVHNIFKKMFYIEVRYNRARRYSLLGGVSPEAFEKASS